jgi:hypothetical protein
MEYSSLSNPDKEKNHERQRENPSRGRGFFPASLRYCAQAWSGRKSPFSAFLDDSRPLCFGVLLQLVKFRSANVRLLLLILFVYIRQFVKLSRPRHRLS